jgi:hypothetical protein
LAFLVKRTFFKKLLVKREVMIEVLSAIGSISGILAMVLFVLFRRSAQKYVDAKAINLASIEDTGKITEEIEAVRSLYLQQSHAWKWIFEKEYDILEKVWKTTFELQSAARSLRPILDHLPENKDEQKKVYLIRYETYANAANGFRDVVFMNKPFIPPNVYDICIELRNTVADLQVDFEMTLCQIRDPNWDKINNAQKKLDEHLERLNQSIRNHVHGKITEAQQYDKTHCR